MVSIKHQTQGRGDQRVAWQTDSGFLIVKLPWNPRHSWKQRETPKYKELHTEKISRQLASLRFRQVKHPQTGPLGKLSQIPGVRAVGHTVARSLKHVSRAANSNRRDLGSSYAWPQLQPPGRFPSWHTHCGKPISPPPPPHHSGHAVLNPCGLL